MWALSLPSLPHNHENYLEAQTHPSLPPPVPPPVYHSLRQGCYLAPSLRYMHPNELLAAGVLGWGTQESSLP